MTDVRDVVSAYFALLDKGRSGEVYNVGSGRETRCPMFCTSCFRSPASTAEIVTDPARVRAARTAPRGRRRPQDRDGHRDGRLPSRSSNTLGGHARRLEPTDRT